MTPVRFISVGFDQLHIRVVNPLHGIPRRSNIERILYFDLQETGGEIRDSQTLVSCSVNECNNTFISNAQLLQI